MKIYLNTNEIFKNISAIVGTNIEKLKEPLLLLRAEASVKRGLIVNSLYVLIKIENLKIVISKEKK